MLTKLILIGATALCTPLEPAPLPLRSDLPSKTAIELADRTVARFGAASIATLGELIAYDTFARAGIANAEHASFKAMSARLKAIASEFGLEFEDHGAVVVIALGQGTDRLGVITHGDVQPADPTKWAASPFILDLASEPGRLVGRGTEDDKGPIANALYAMRAIAEAELPLKRRIELIVSYTEESDWDPFREFLAANPPPQLNVAFDASYPVVIAEKGWCSIEVGMPLQAPESGRPGLLRFGGGFFLSQVPEDASAQISNSTPELESKLMAAARAIEDVHFGFFPTGSGLNITARGISAHSSSPQEGRNGITHLAQLLGCVEWPPSTAAHMLRFINEMIGTGYYAEQFGDVAYADDFMGPLTISLGKLEERDGKLWAGINMRRPVGRSNAQVKESIDSALAQWSRATGIDIEHTSYVGEPHPPVDAPHVNVLLDTFRHYTGIQDAQPIAIGGGTHARMVPAGVNFGPQMPGVPYSGHSEHEFVERTQYLLDLRMFTSLLVDLTVDLDSLTQQD